MASVMGEGYCVKTVVCASSAGHSAELLCLFCGLQFQEMLSDMEAHQPQKPPSVFPSTCCQVIGSSRILEALLGL